MAAGRHRLLTPMLSFMTMALALLWPPEPASGAAWLYRATLVQAAPGRLLELINLEKALHASLAESGDEAPLWMRHSQGDKWDLLLLYPMRSWAEYDGADRIARREKWRQASQAALGKVRDAIAWQEDVFVFGPPLSEVRAQMAGAGFFHVEMFVSLPGRQADLLRQREMENAYDKSLGLPQNLIFTRDRGAAWDLFTIGCFRDLKHYAASADIPAPYSHYTSAVTLGQSGTDVTLYTTSVPEHKSPYFSPPDPRYEAYNGTNPNWAQNPYHIGTQSILFTIPSSPAAATVLRTSCS